MAGRRVRVIVEVMPGFVLGTFSLVIGYWLIAPITIGALAVIASIAAFNRRKR